MSIESEIQSNHLISVVPFSSCLQSFPASGSFPMSQFFPSGGQSISASVSTSVLPMNIQCWFPLGLTGWISLLSKWLSKVFSYTIVQKHQFSAFFTVQLSHPYMIIGKIIALAIQTFVGKVASLLFNTLSRFAIALLPRSKNLLISWLQAPSAVILESKKIKSVTVSIKTLIKPSLLVEGSVSLKQWNYIPRTFMRKKPRVDRGRSTGRKLMIKKSCPLISEKASLKLNILKTRIMAPSPITSWQIEGEKVEVVTDFLFLGFQITVDGECSHKIRKWLLLGRKAMTNLDSVLKSKDITSSTKVCIVKAMVFPVIMYNRFSAFWLRSSVVMCR